MPRPTRPTRLTRASARLAVLTVGALAAVLTTAPPARATADPALGVTVVGPVTSYVGSSNLNVVGEVLAGSQTVESVRVTLAVLGRAGQQVATATAYSTVGVLAPGSRSPFLARVLPVPTDHAAVRVLSVTASPALHAASLIHTITPTTTPDADAASQGTVTNDLPYPADLIRVIGTFYDAVGAPVFTSYVDAQDARYAFATPPGETRRYAITRGDGAPAFDPARTRLTAETNDPGAAVPTPAVAAPTGAVAAVRHRTVVTSTPARSTPRPDPAPSGVRSTVLPPAPPARHDAVPVRRAAAASPSAYASLAPVAAAGPGAGADGGTGLLGVLGVFGLVVGGALLLARRLGPGGSA